MKLNDVVYVSFHMLGHLSAWRANYFDSSVLFYARCWGRIYPHGPTLNFDFAHSPNQSKTTCFAMQDRGGLQVIEELRAEKEAMKKRKLQITAEINAHSTEITTSLKWVGEAQARAA